MGAGGSGGGFGFGVDLFAVLVGAGGSGGGVGFGVDLFAVLVGAEGSVFVGGTGSDCAGAGGSGFVYKDSDLAVSGGVGCGGTEPISVCPSFSLMVLSFRAAISCLASLSFRIKSWSLWISSSPLLCRFGGDFFAFLVGARDSGGGVGFGGELFAVLVGVGGTGSGLGDVAFGFGVDLFAVLVGLSMT